MGIRYMKKHAILADVVGVEDAEPLMQWLRGTDQPAVGLQHVGHVHAAVLQVLLALRPRLVGVPADPWLASTLGLEPGEGA